MSILNVWLTQHRALVVADSAVALHGGASHDVAKLLTFPFAGLVAAARGDIALLNHVAAFIHASGGDIDTLGGVHGSLSSMLPPIAGQLEAAREVHGYPLGEEAEIALVGWSPDRQCMVGFVWTRPPGRVAFACEPIDPWRIGPNANWATAPESPTCDADAESIATAQIRYMRAHHPKAAIGGRLTIAEIGPNWISTRTSDLNGAERHAG